MSGETRTLSLVLGVLGLVPGLRAQDPDPVVMQEKLDAKLGEPWVEKGGWITDFAKAKEVAKKEKKLVFAYFTRSYSP
ncbi:MAG: hypothetical protein R3F30_15895 [Planctomycetota bacterium]